MSLSFNAIVFELTSRCNAQCKMCYQAAGPKGSTYVGDVALKLEDTINVLEQARNIPGLPDRVHFGGGEGFLDQQMMYGVIAYARQLGFRDVTAVSNCFWGVSETRANQVAEKLAEAGLSQMEISWDVWHAPYVKAERVATAIRALHRAGVETNLRLLTTKSVRGHEAFDMLGRDIIEALDEIAIGNVLPTGEAAEEFPHDELYGGQNLDAGCMSNLNLTINPAGKVAPCCSGADQIEALCFGDVRTDRLVDIVERMNESALLSDLVRRGSRSFLELLREQGFDVPEDDAFLGPCHACWTVFSDPEKANAVKRVLEVVEKESVVEWATSYFNAESA
ncbi:SPASM domain-containing protein [Maricaulaceae bacterium NA33B04]|nr:SPASM domain-containing protein [Maricaulaceae bacterium NA33B04]